MNISLIIIVIIILILLNFKVLFTSSNPTQDYLNAIKNDQNVISNIISDPNFSILINNVPGQNIFNIAGNPPTVSQIIIPGNPDKVNVLKNKFSQLLLQADQLISAINDYIAIAQNTTGVYTPEKLNAFNLYYKNMLNNIQIIKKYIK